MFDLETIIYRNQQRAAERERRQQEAKASPPVHQARTVDHDYIKGAS